jgi:hypothetical protein
MSERIRVDAADLTLGEMADIAEALGDPGEGVTRPGDNFRYTAALAWATKRRTDPTYTLAQALKLKMADLEMVDHDPEARGAANGATPQPSPAPGRSTQPT